MAEAKKISAFQMRLMKLVMTPFSRWQARRYLESGGTRGVQFAGRDVCVVTTRGARSGKSRHIPLMHVPYLEGEGVLLVASLGGAPRHPTWYYNLVANPDIRVQVRERSLSLRARVASAEEKTAVWPTCCEHYPDYQLYQDRTSRDIPVFLCEPRDA